MKGTALGRLRWLWPCWIHRRRRSEHPRALHIRSGRRPHQRFIYAFAFLQGLAGLTLPNYRSSAITTQMPLWAIYLWFTAQVVMAGAVLVATLPKERPVDLLDPQERRELRGSLQCEAVGLAGMLFTSLGFGTAILLYAGPSGTQVGITFAGFVCAAGTRFVEIVHDLRKLTRVERHPTLLPTSVVADPGPLP